MGERGDGDEAEEGVGAGGAVGGTRINSESKEGSSDLPPPSSSGSDGLLVIVTGSDGPGGEANGGGGGGGGGNEIGGGDGGSGSGGVCLPRTSEERRQGLLKRGSSVRSSTRLVLPLSKTEAWDDGVFPGILSWESFPRKELVRMCAAAGATRDVWFTALMHPQGKLKKRGMQLILPGLRADRPLEQAELAYDSKRFKRRMRWAVRLHRCVDVRRGLPIGKVKSAWFAAVPSAALGVCVDGDLGDTFASLRRLDDEMPVGKSPAEGEDHAEGRITLMHAQAKSEEEADKLYAALKIAAQFARVAYGGGGLVGQPGLRARGPRA